MANTVPSALSPRIQGVAVEALSETFAVLSKANGDHSAEAAQKGQTINVAVPASLSAAAVTAANTAPAPSDITTGSKTITLNQEYKTSFALQAKHDQDYELSTATQEQIKEAVRGVAKQVNLSLIEQYYKIPYFVGNSGTGFFASNANLLSEADRILTDNLCPLEDRVWLCGTKDYAALINLTEVHYANQFGGAVAQSGVVGDVRGFEVHRDQQLNATNKHTIGTLTDTGNIVCGANSVGDTSISVDCTAGTAAVDLKAGDIIAFSGATSEYYAIQADVTIAHSATGTITIDRGLETALAGNETMAFATDSGSNVFDADSIVMLGGNMKGLSIASRLPETAPMGYRTQGEHMPIVDPVSGFPMLLSIYPQYKQVALEVSAIWGVQVTDSKRLIRGLTYSS